MKRYSVNEIVKLKIFFLIFFSDFAGKTMQLSCRPLLVAAAAAVCFAELTSSRACIPRDLVSRLRGGGSRDRAEIMADLEVLRRQRDAGEVSQDDFRRRKDALKQVRAAARPHPGPCLRTHLRRDRAWHPRCDTRFCRAPALSLPALTRRLFPGGPGRGPVWLEAAQEREAAKRASAVMCPPLADSDDRERCRSLALQGRRAPLGTRPVDSRVSASCFRPAGRSHGFTASPGILLR